MSVCSKEKQEFDLPPPSPPCGCVVRRGCRHTLSTIRVSQHPAKWGRYVIFVSLSLSVSEALHIKTFLLVLAPHLIKVQEGNVQSYCVILWPVTVTALNYIPSFCLVKSILTNRDLGEGTAHLADIFHRHLLTYIYKQRHQGSGGLFHLSCFFLPFIRSLGDQRWLHVPLEIKCERLTGWVSHCSVAHIQLQSES